MISLQDIKRLIRSRSWDYAINGWRPTSNTQLKNYRWRGQEIYYRPGTYDTGALYDILIRPARNARSNTILRTGRKLEYWAPAAIDPKVILDIGGNIGLASVYYANTFPNAQIYAFEPVKENFELFQKNTEKLPNVKAFNFGLGAEDSTVKMYNCQDPRNKGGFSIYEDMEINNNSSFEIEIKHGGNFLRSIGVNNVDLIKIDTEGAEYDILTNLPMDLIANAKWITGELHGHKDFALLEYLSQWFDLSVKKPLNERLHMFDARNKKYRQTITRRD